MPQVASWPVARQNGVERLAVFFEGDCYQFYDGKRDNDGQDEIDEREINAVAGGKENQFSDNRRQIAVHGIYPERMAHKRPELHVVDHKVECVIKGETIRQNDTHPHDMLHRIVAFHHILSIEEIQENRTDDKEQQSTNRQGLVLDFQYIKTMHSDVCSSHEIYNGVGVVEDFWRNFYVEKEQDDGCDNNDETNDFVFQQDIENWRQNDEVDQSKNKPEWYILLGQKDGSQVIGGSELEGVSTNKIFAEIERRYDSEDERDNIPTKKRDDQGVKSLLQFCKIHAQIEISEESGTREDKEQGNSHTGAPGVHLLKNIYECGAEVSTLCIIGIGGNMDKENENSQEIRNHHFLLPKLFLCHFVHVCPFFLLIGCKITTNL